MTESIFKPDAIAARFAEAGFVCTGELATTLFLADSLSKPLLLEGPPGVGKTEVAKLWADLHGARLVRLQCYEGLDEARALYEWSYGKQMLYAQLLRGRGDTAADIPLDEAVRALHGKADAFFSREFLLPRPLLEVILADDPVLLLVDEVDRSDEEFEAFLLEVLAEAQVTIPELGTLRARQRPRVVLTSNDSRDLSDALRRRCLYLYIDYPSFEDEVRIVRARVPDAEARLVEQLVRFTQNVRKAAVRKQPGIAETLDWALALTAVGADGLGSTVVRRTLGALLKSREDVEHVLANLPRFK